MTQQSARPFQKWLFPLCCLIALVGYFAPWVNHKAAALVITGLDLGEYVKFLPTIRSGEVKLWREGFYLPLVAVSLSLSLNAFRKEHNYHWLLRWVFIVIALIAAFNLLPPAWSPPVLKSAEFRQQMLAIILCGLAAAFSPFLALLPRRLTAIITLLLVISALWFPIRGFFGVLPTISQLYNHPLQPGWGMWLMIIGLLGLAASSILEALSYQSPMRKSTTKQ